MGFLLFSPVARSAQRIDCKDSSEREQEVHIALLCAHFAAMKKKLKNICDFIWWYQKISVPLHPLIETYGTTP